MEQWNSAAVLAGPGRERKGWAELAPWSKALLPLVLPASKDLARVGGIPPAPRLVSPVLTSALGFVTPSLFPVNSKKEKANAKYTHRTKLAREMSWREAGSSFGMRLSSGVGMGWGRGQRRQGGCREMWVSAFLGTGPGHSRELGAAERHRKVRSGHIPLHSGDLLGPSLLPLVSQLQLTALFTGVSCGSGIAGGQPKLPREHYSPMPGAKPGPSHSLHHISA